VDDPRVQGTISAIEQHLVGEMGLVLRCRTGEGATGAN
jgi:hypothetical protein